MAYGSSSNSGGSSRSSRGGESPLVRGTGRVRKQTTKPIASKPLIIKPKPTDDGGDMKVTGLTQRPLNLNPVQANSIKTELNREVFNKTAFNNTVDTNFSELDQLPPDLSFFDPNLATVDDFFSIYQNLFFEIPKFGDINSHQYLVIESTEYTGFIENQAQIDALLEEIVDLREQNLQLQLDINELMGVKETIDQAIRQSGEGANLEDLLQQEADLGAEQSNSSSDLLGTTSDGSTLPSQGGMGGNSGGGGGGGGIPGVTQGLTDAFQQQTGGDPLPPNPFGPGGGSNTNPGIPKY